MTREDLISAGMQHALAGEVGVFPKLGAVLAETPPVNHFENPQPLLTAEERFGAYLEGIKLAQKLTQ